MLDTGSEDRSVELLEAGGAMVRRAAVDPWRFDEARNLALGMVPDDADVCLCLDMDEVVSPGWREALEAAWVPGIKRGYYHFVYSVNPDGSEGGTFMRGHIHARYGFEWRYPVHEALTWTDQGDCATASIPAIKVRHLPDDSKPRSIYLPMLELAARENPEDDRCLHHLGREYMYYRRWQDCIDTLKKHLDISAWEEERGASMRFIARAYTGLENTYEAERWLLRAAAETPEFREPWTELSTLYHTQGEWLPCLCAAKRALSITEKPANYITEAAPWHALPYDLASIASYNLGLYADALRYGAAAAELAPGDERITSNLEYFKKAAEA